MRDNGSHNGKLPLQMSDERNKGFDIGDILRRARIEKGLSLEEVQEATKIRTRYLEGLEREDYDLLPDAVYVRGFLKTYADFLGLDDEELIRELRRQQTGGQEPYYVMKTPRKDEFEEPVFKGNEFGSSSGGSSSGRSSSGPSIFSGPTLLIAVAVLIFLVGILYFIGRGSQSADETAPPPDSGNGQAAVANEGEKNQDEPASGGQPSPGEESPEQDPAPPDDQPAPSEEQSPEQKPVDEGGGEPPAPPPPDTLEAKVTVQGNISWLQIEVDGTTEMAQVARPGFSRTFVAEDEISINTGNAGAVRVEVNGQDVGLLGGSGQVKTRKFTLKSAANAGA